MRFLNILALLSLIFIITIGFNLYIFTLPFPEQFFNKLNGILLNLSYSYSVGYITYLFSAYYPQKKKERQKRAKLKIYVDTFFHRTNLAISSYKYTIEWTGNYMDRINDKDLYTLSEYISLRNYINEIRDNKRHECCEAIEREFLDFKLYLSGFEEYLTPKQDSALTSTIMLIDQRDIRKIMSQLEKHLIKEKDTSHETLTWESISKSQKELAQLELLFLNHIESIQPIIQLLWKSFKNNEESIV